MKLYIFVRRDKWFYGKEREREEEEVEYLGVGHDNLAPIRDS